MTARNDGQPKYWERSLERTERVAELTRQGLTARLIAERLHISERTVERHRRLGGVAKQVHTPFSADEERRARELLEDGASIEEVAKTLGRSRSPIYLRFSEYVWTPKQASERALMGRQLAQMRSINGS